MILIYWLSLIMLKNLEKATEWILRSKLPYFGTKIGPILSNWPKIFWKFHQSNFFQTVVHYNAAKFGKNSYSISWGIGLDNFVPKSSQNCLFGSQEDFSGNFVQMIFIYLFCPIMMQSLKNILTADLEMQACLNLAHNWPQKKKKKKKKKGT